MPSTMIAVMTAWGALTIKNTDGLAEGSHSGGVIPVFSLHPALDDKGVGAIADTLAGYELGDDRGPRRH